MCPDNDIIVTFVADKEFIYEYYDTAFARILIIVNNKWYLNKIYYIII